MKVTDKVVKSVSRWRREKKMARQRNGLVLFLFIDIMSFDVWLTSKMFMIDLKLQSSRCWYTDVTTCLDDLI
jgi:hypothetical protein